MLAHKPISRRDYFYVAVEGDPRPWDRADGGARIIGGYEPLELERYWDADAGQWLAHYIDRIGVVLTVTLRDMDAAGAVLDSGYRYHAQLTEVHGPGPDANSADVATLGLRLQPTSVRALPQPQVATCA